MKTIFLIALFALIVEGNTFATGLKKSNPAVASTSHSELIKGANYLIGGSISDNQQIEAPSSGEGLLAGSGQKEILNQLPVQPNRTVSKMLDGYDVKKATIFKETTGDGFYIAAENEHEYIVVKIDDEFNVSICKKIKK